MPEGAGSGPLARERDVLLPPRACRALRIATGERLQVIDEDGLQVCDVVILSADDSQERMSTHSTIMRNGSIYLTARHAVYSVSQEPLMRVVEDTVGAGGHDMLAGMCSEASTRLKFGIAGAPNCTDNLRRALSEFGVGPELVVDSLNLFMRMQVAPDGAVTIEEPISRAGDYVVLEAVRDCLVGVSNCPQEWGPTNARELGRIRLKISPDAESDPPTR